MTYHATAERDGNWWLVHVAEIDYYTQARSLRDVPAQAADLVATILERDVSPESVEVEVRLPESVREHLDESERLRRNAAEATTEAAAESRAAAAELRTLGLTMRDIGETLGVSYQRAHQLVSG